MEELSRIEARLESLAELGELVGALRSMAGSRANDARRALEGTRAYRGIVERAIASVAPLAGGVPGSPENGNHARKALVVLTSENGFVGGFNTRIVEHALSVRGQDEALLVAGRRGRITADEHGVPTTAGFAMASRSNAVTPLARRIVSALDGMAEVRLIYAQARNGGAYEVLTEDVLPLKHGPPADDPPEPPLIHLPPEDLLRRLGAEYLFAQIADAIMESLASENLARLRTMDAASRNIDDKLEKLQRDERVARQEKTTSDMIDVVTGAEAAME